MTIRDSSRFKFDCDVAIIGAGPVGLLIANLLGRDGHKVLVLEALPALIDYPRGVGMDDECLRAFQNAGLADEVLRHTTPQHWMRFVDGRGRVMASIEPATHEFGWPRRNAFIQPLVDQVLANGLERYPGVELRMGQTVERFTQDATGASIDVANETGSYRIRARYVVGCDGGRSATRKALGIEFTGRTDENRWIVVDLAHDPIGRPNAYLHADPARPYVSIALPHGIRRFEFMLLPGEGENDEVPRDVLDGMLAKVVPDPFNIDLIRARVYTHSGRIASNFRDRRILIAGDAAHIMPVWQGQGYNSGIRDATNLAWKLSYVLSCVCDDALLDSYELERRQHVQAMIALSETAGRVLAMRKKWAVCLRTLATRLMGYMPPIKRYFLEMRFKPMPRYRLGALDYGPFGFTAASPVGRLFIQPRVRLSEKEAVRLDEVLGTGFAVIAWGADPSYWLSQDAEELLHRLRARVLYVVPETQLEYESERASMATPVGDAEGILKRWFDDLPDSVVILRPDRFVAATCSPQDITVRLTSLAKALHVGGESLATSPASANLAA